MMYCETCNYLTEEDTCPVCGGTDLREPKEKDPCFLTEQDYVFSGVLEDVLRQNGIPFMRRNVLGAGLAMRVGPTLDRGRFYVAYDMLPKAQELVDSFFPSDEDGEQAE